MYTLSHVIDIAFHGADVGAGTVYWANARDEPVCFGGSTMEKLAFTNGRTFTSVLSAMGPAPSSRDPPASSKPVAAVTAQQSPAKLPYTAHIVLTSTQLLCGRVRVPLLAQALLLR